MGTFRNSEESSEINTESQNSSEEEVYDKMTTIEKSFINRRRYKSIIEQEETLVLERLQVMKFALSQFLLKFAKNN